VAGQRCRSMSAFFSARLVCGLPAR
jgi:hypothetical protein